VARISLDTAELETFLTIARTGSFTQAARTLCLSQPSVSQRVQRLEGELGTRLFDRTGRKVELTAAGLRLRDRAEPIVAEMHAMLAEFRDEQQARQRELVVAASPMLAAVVLPAVVRRVTEDTPGAVVHIHDKDAGAALEDLATGQADLAVMVMEGSDPRFAADPLPDDECVVVAQAGHPLLARAAVDFDEILRHPIVLSSSQVALVRVVKQEFERRGLAFRPTLSATTVRTTLGMVGAGMGITIAPSRVVNATNSADLGAVRIEGAPILRHFSTVQLRNHVPSPIARSFCALLRQEWQRLGPVSGG
jgi:DNA-binding transcriptional LysR family regulator